MFWPMIFGRSVELRKWTYTAHTPWTYVVTWLGNAPFSTENMHLHFSSSSWWLNQPLWKICSSKWVHLPPIFGVKIWKNLWVGHHLVHLYSSSSKWLVNGLYPTYNTWGILRLNNPLILTFDPNFQQDIKATLPLTVGRCSKSPSATPVERTNPPCCTRWPPAVRSRDSVNFQSPHPPPEIDSTNMTSYLVEPTQLKNIS